jgi:hypothetical protein
MRGIEDALVLVKTKGAPFSMKQAATDRAARGAGLRRQESKDGQRGKGTDRYEYF